MNVKVSHLLATFAAFFLLSWGALAQEELPMLETQDPTHRELNLDEDKTLIYDHPSHTSTVRDSIQSTPRLTPVQPAKTSRPENYKGSRKEKNEEDALSFNFLYYMIQKFKLSDLIDQ